MNNTDAPKFFRNMTGAKIGKRWFVPVEEVKEQILTHYIPKDKVLEAIGEDIPPEVCHLDKEWGEGYSCVVCEKNYRQNQLRKKLRAKLGLEKWDE